MSRSFRTEKSTPNRRAAQLLIAACFVLLPLSEPALAAQGLREQTQTAEHCRLLGLEPGMYYKEALKKLGDPQGINKFDLPSRSHPGENEEYRDYTWEDKQRRVDIESNDIGEITRIIIKQKRGSTVGPLGVLIGRETVAKAINRIGRPYISVSRIKCSSEGDTMTVGFESCGGVAQAFIYYTVDVEATDTNAGLCETTPPVEDLVKLVGQLVIRRARLEY